jgi:Tfp pilus assembly protein PilN
MSTGLMPPTVASAHAYRMLSIGANLLPAEIVASRRGRRVRAVVLGSLGLVLVLVAVSYGVATLRTVATQGDLTTAENRIADLTRQQGAFNELITTQQRSRAIKAQLSALLVNDLQWKRLLSDVRRAAPNNVRLGEIAGAIGTGTQSGAPSDAVRLPDTSGKKLIGELTVTGTGTSKAAVADYVDALAKVTGLANPALTSATEQGGLVHFSVQLDITEAALGGRYTPQDGTKAEGK